MYEHDVFAWDSAKSDTRYYVDADGRATRWEEHKSVQLGPRIRMVIVQVTKYTKGVLVTDRLLRVHYSDQN